MTRNQEIIQLFSKDFECKNFLKKGDADNFTCPNIKKCEVKKTKEPIWTSYLGDENTKIMIVAEAPSKTGGKGPKIGGLTTDNMEDTGLKSLFNFVKNNFDTVPYFTDLMKCGVATQTKEAKKIFKIRKTNCMEHYLLEEIRIIKPKTILCVGAESYDALQKAKEKKQIDDEIKIIKLIHYGRQANLPLTSEDKENLIWPFQLKKISKDRMIELDYFNKES